MRIIEHLAGKRAVAARIAGFAGLLAVPVLGWAGTISQPVSEPESLALLGIGAAALVVARWAKKRASRPEHRIDS
jgi:hypothetical protein